MDEERQYVDRIELKREAVIEYYRLSQIFTTFIPIVGLCVAYVFLHSFWWLVPAFFPFGFMLVAFEFFIHMLKGAPAGRINEYFEDKCQHRKNKSYLHDDHNHDYEDEEEMDESEAELH